MPDTESVEIKVSRVIPAEKWRVIRCITKVADFPSYIPCVKEATVLEKHHNVMVTRWRVQVDSVPISWVEEDMILLEEDLITFRAFEGDLEEFHGAWIIKDHPEGTQVTVNVFISVGVPAIQEFADLYIKKLLTRNFEAILEAVERRLISTRYASFKRGNLKKVAGFGVIGHFYNYYHLEKGLKLLNPKYKMPSREFLGQLFNLTPSFKMHDVPEFRSKAGAITCGRFILATFIPDMIEKDMHAIFSKVVKACKIAEKYGVGVVSLGGFTSIVAERIGQEISQEVDVPVTTGNTYTAAMVIEGVIKAARALDLDLAQAKATIVGGTGDIGSACARVLAEKVKQVTVTGRTKANIARIKTELMKRRKAAILATTENRKAIEDADIVIAAASVSSSILEIGWFKPGAIICDVGYPKNISYAPVTRKDILIFSGGLTISPQPIAFPVDAGLPSPDTLYGCFAEAIILALENRFENYSFGRGNISVEKINEIRDLGKKHGFEVSKFYWGDKEVTEDMIAKIRHEALR